MIIGSMCAQIDSNSRLILEWTSFWPDPRSEFSQRPNATKAKTLPYPCLEFLCCSNRS